MRYLKPGGQDAAFHFSVEEYFMEHAPLSEPIFMIWQADKCAMLGAYQVAQAEVDLSYAREMNIQIVRRQSGGGTIFTDLGTLLYTLILPESSAKSSEEIVRELFAAPLVRALNKLGIPTQMEGRNDLLVDGKKFSGIAQYVRQGRVCSHGSLLYDTDLDMLTRVLQVNPDKIKSKGIQSVRSRVTNLQEHMGESVSLQEFWTILERALAEEWALEQYTLTAMEIETIDSIYEKKYGNPEWNFGRSPKFSYHNSKRFTAGKIEIFVDVVQGKILECSICGDFLGTVPIQGLEQMLENCDFRYETVDEALSDVNLAPYLGAITKEQVLSCLFE